MSTNFVPGLLPSPKDSRDIPLSFFRVLSEEVVLPSSFSLVEKQTSIKQQENMPFCAGFTGVAAREYFEKLQNVSQGQDLSEQFLYYRCKQIDGIPDAPGTYLRAVASVLKNDGVCEDRFWPFENHWPPHTVMSMEATDNAKQYKITGYSQLIPDVTHIKNGLFVTGPVLIGVIVNSPSFYSAKYDGIIKMPGANDIEDGGHAMLIVGWDDNWEKDGYKGCFVLKNSWGDYGTKGGYLILPYSVWDAIRMEAWVIMDNHGFTIHWSDWLGMDPNKQFLLEQDVVYKENIFQGYVNGELGVVDPILKHQVAVVAARLKAFHPELGIDVPSGAVDVYEIATRGWVREVLPGLDWKEDRLLEPITRFQIVLLVARLLIKNGVVANKNKIYI
jgi:hypothetical protein